MLELTINPVNRVLLNDLNKSYGAILSAVMFILLKAFLSFRSVDEIVALTIQIDTISTKYFTIVVSVTVSERWL